jgi:inner membrane protein
MPTIFTHAVSGAALAQVLAPCSIRRGMTWIAAACAILPDADVIGFEFNLRYGSMFGHRGITHSILFAGVLAVVAVAVSRRYVKSRELPRMWVCLFAATLSHGILDSLTNGGMGVAFLAPFDDSRYFLPWAPIQVSPIGVRAFLTWRGAAVLANEFEWIWCPSIVMIVAARLLRCRQVS